MFNSIFKIIYFVLFVVTFVIRKIFTAQNSKQKFIVDRKSPGDILLLTLDGVGMILPLVYVFSSWLDFANYDMPDWLGWIGVVLFGFDHTPLESIHEDLLIFMVVIFTPSYILELDTFSCLV